jgi:hypothetical protein
MKVRADIAELLRAGVPQSHICRQLHCAPITVQRTREALGLPAPKAGPPGAPSLAEAFRQNAIPSEDGHLMWRGFDTRSTPRLTYGGRTYSGYRLAFVLHYRREPVGRVTAACGALGCVRGDHVADEPMRATNARADRVYAAVFGRSS